MRRAAWLALAAALPALLAASGAVAPSAEAVRPIEVGAAIPDAELRGVDGASVRLHDVTGEGAVALVFYRGGW